MRMKEIDRAIAEIPADFDFLCEQNDGTAVRMQKDRCERQWSFKCHKRV
jgi:hypothetical protein